MGVIQSSINQALGATAAMSTIGKHLMQERARSIEAQKAANAKAEKLKEAKAHQKESVRRNFMKDYLSKQPTSLGGTVGDLPIDLQKQIAAQYSKSQRKAMMDRMDREAHKRG